MKRILLILAILLTAAVSYGQFNPAYKVRGNQNVYGKQWVADSLWNGRIEGLAQYYVLVTKDGLVDTVNVYVSGDTLFTPTMSADSVIALWLHADTATVIYAEIDSMSLGWVSVDTVIADYGDFVTLHADSLFVDSLTMLVNIPLSNSDTLLVLSGDTIKYRLDYWDTTATWIAPRDTFMIINSDTIYAINGLRVLYQEGSGVFLGLGSGLVNTGNYNLGLGQYTLMVNTVGINNIAIGHGAMVTTVDGSGSVGIGVNSLSTNASSNYNVGVGTNSGQFVKGNNGMYLGYYSGAYLNDSVDGRLIVNMRDQGNASGDTTGALITGWQHATDSTQNRVRVNGKLSIFITPASTSDTIMVISGDTVYTKLECDIVPDSAYVCHWADSAGVAVTDTVIYSLLIDSTHCYEYLTVDTLKYCGDALVVDGILSADTIGFYNSGMQAYECVDIMFIDSINAPCTGTLGIGSPIDVNGTATVTKSVVTGDTVVVGNIMTITYSDTLAYGDSILIGTTITAPNCWVSVDTIGIMTGLTIGFSFGNDGTLRGGTAMYGGGNTVNIGVDNPGYIAVVNWGASVYIKNNRWKHQRVSYELKILM